MERSTRIGNELNDHIEIINSTKVIMIKFQEIKIAGTFISINN